MNQFSLDMFADPIKPPSTDGPRASVASFRGRLVMITPKSISQVPKKDKPTELIDRVVADVMVVDGRGPVPEMSYGTPTGVMIPGDEHRAMWIENTYLVDQMRALVGQGRPMLGTLETKVPGTQPRSGNPWGLNVATQEQKQQAVNYLNTRAVNGAAAPAPVHTVASVQAAAASQTGPKPGANPFA